MDINEILETIPHRYPFVLVDKVLELDIGKKIVAQKNVSYNESFFQGHFPQEPVMPGVLIIEALAQAGAIALMKMEEYEGKIAYFSKIDNAKFRKKVLPGDILRLEVELIKLRKIAGVAKGFAYVDDKLACEAELTFMLN